MWTGSEVLYKLGADGEWTLLDRLYLTDFVEDYQNLCPEGLEDYYPPFLDVFPEGDIIQIGTGYSLIGDEGNAIGCVARSIFPPMRGMIALKR